MSIWKNIYFSPEDGGGGPSRKEALEQAEALFQATEKQKKVTEEVTKAESVYQRLLSQGDVVRADRVRVLADEIALLEQRTILTKEVNDKLEFGLQIREKELQLEIESLKTSKKYTEATKKEQAAMDAKLSKRQEYLENEREGIEVGKELTETLFGLATATKQVDQINRMVQGGFKGVISAFKSQASFAAISAASMSKLGELSLGFGAALLKMATAQDEARSTFMKTTGAGIEYGQTISNIQRQTALYGVDSAEAGQAVTDLFTNFSQFSQLNEASQRSLGRTVSLLAELGVGAGVSAKNLDIATRSLGMNATEAEELLREVKAMSDAIGLPASKLAQDFSSAAPILAKYGREMVGVFEGLAEQSKQTGIEINQLLSITGKFDTFEGAARAVGRLNAILGGPYLNSIDLLNATDEERIEILQRLTNVAGLQFDELNRFERMAIADAMGVSVDEANRIFGATTAQFEKQRLAQKELADQAAEAQSVMDQLRAAFNAMLIDMQPLIDDAIIPMIRGFRHMVEGGQAAGTALSNLTKTVTKTMGILGLLMIIGGVIALFATGGSAAPIALPIIMAGLKMAGIGFAGMAAIGAVEDAAGQAKAGISTTGLARSAATLPARIMAPGSPVSTVAAGGYRSRASMAVPGAGTQQVVAVLDPNTTDALNNVANAQMQAAAAQQKAADKPNEVVITDRMSGRLYKRGQNAFGNGLNV